MNETLLESNAFSSPDEEIKYLRNKITEERENHRKIEENLRNQLEYSLRSAEKISQECDRAVYVAEKLKSIVDGSASITENGFENELLNEINSMRLRSQKINHMNQRYRSDAELAHSENLKLKNSLSKIFNETLSSVKTTPKYASNIIKIAKEVDMQNVDSVINSIIYANKYIISCLK